MGGDKQGWGEGGAEPKTMRRDYSKGQEKQPLLGHGRLGEPFKNPLFRASGDKTQT